MDKQRTSNVEETELFRMRWIPGADVRRFRLLCGVRSPYLPTTLQAVERDGAVLVYEARLDAQPVQAAEDGELTHIAYAAAQTLLALHAVRFCHGAVRKENMLRLADGTFVLAEPAAAAGDPEQDIRAWGEMLLQLGCRGGLMRVARRCAAGRVSDAKALCAALDRIQSRKKRCLRYAGMAAVFCAVMGLGVLGMQVLPQGGEPVPCACTVDHRGAYAYAPQETVFVPGQSVQVQLELSCRMLQDHCEAAEHELPRITNCEIVSSTVGGAADVTGGGLVTVTKPGVYKVSGLMEHREEYYYLEMATLYVLSEDEQPAGCRCVFDAGRSRPSFDATYKLPKEGMLTFPMTMREVLDDRACSAQTHCKVVYAPGEVLMAPEGAVCGVDEDNNFFCDTVGIYEICVHFYFAGKEESATCTLIVE